MNARKHRDSNSIFSITYSLTHGYYNSIFDRFRPSGVNNKITIYKLRLEVKDFRTYDQSEGTFKTIIPNELLEEEHSERIIKQVVDRLNLSKVYDHYSDEGR